MIILDTNVVSELMRHESAPTVLSWLDRQTDRMFLTATSAAELRYGVARLPAGRRRIELSDVFETILAVDFHERVLPFDEIASAHFANLVAQRERSGTPISMADAQIAAICRSHAASIATRNVKDFSDIGLTIVNPWTD